MIPWKAADRKRREKAGVWVRLVIGAILLLALPAWAEGTDISMAAELGIRHAVSEEWQVIHPDKHSTFTVCFFHPDPLELGDEISFYCTFQGCHRGGFRCEWQYGDGVTWTNFGSSPRKNTAYTAMLAGRQVRLVVKWK